MPRTRTLTLAVVLCTVAACKTDFDPRGPFERALVLYSVMQSSSDSHFVRLHATYDPPGFDPLAVSTEPDLSLATVTVSSDSGVVVYGDTLIPHPDPQRYAAPLRVFYGSPFTPVRGGRYTLTAQLPGYPTATAVSTFPGPITNFRIGNAFVLDSPRQFGSTDLNITFKRPTIAPGRGFLPRLFVEFEVLSPSSQIRIVEIPSAVTGIGPAAVETYPDLIPMPGPVDVSFTFMTDAYRHILIEILTEHGSSNVSFLRVIARLYMVDEKLYEYYNVVNGFRDEFSIRTDKPDITNVSGGVGVFGSVSLDTVSVPIGPRVDL